MSALRFVVSPVPCVISTVPCVVSTRGRGGLPLLPPTEYRWSTLGSAPCDRDEDEQRHDGERCHDRADVVGVPTEVRLAF